MGLIEDSARFFGAKKLAGDADKPNWLWNDGTPKSLMPELNIMPVRLPESPQPKLRYKLQH